MDAVINGEIPDESLEKEKKSDFNTEENIDSVSCNSREDHAESPTKSNVPPLFKETLADSPTSSKLILPQSESSENEVIVSGLHENGSDTNVNKQPVINCSESINSVPFTDVSTSDQLKISETREPVIESSAEIHLDSDVVTPNLSGSNQSNACEIGNSASNQTGKLDQTPLSDKNLPTVKALETSYAKETTELPSNSDLSNLCQKPVSVTSKTNNSEKITKFDETCTNLSPPTKLLTDSPLVPLNKNTEEICMANNFHLNSVSAKPSEQIHENILQPFSQSANKEQSNMIFDHSKVISLDSAAANSSDICNSESNPLEQLNQHLKSIGCDGDEVQSYNLCRTNAPNVINSDKDKNLSKSPPKDNAPPVERIKESDSFVFTEISKEETGFPEVFTGLVTIGKYISVKGDFTLRSSEALVESPSLIAPYLLKEPDMFPPRVDDSKLEQKDFFHSAAGGMLIGVGFSLVNEWFHRDMTRIKKRQIKSKGKTPELEEELKMHESIYNEAKNANKIYSFSLKTCEKCGFSTESSIVMEGHLLVPHITPRREYQCSFCDIINRDPKAMLEHMYRIHGKTGRIQPPVLFFECPYCTFESNSKVKLGNHLTKCQRFYDPARNQAPPKDFEFPALTPKPITVAVVKAYEKSLSSMQRGRGRPKKTDNIAEQLNLNQFAPPVSHSPMVPNPPSSYRPSSSVPLTESISGLSNQMISPMQMPNMNLRPPHTAMSQLRPGISPMHLPSTNRFYQVVNSSAQIMPMLGNSPLVTSPSQFPFTPNLVNSASKKVPTPSPHFLNSFFGSGLRQQNPPKTVPEITITPLPKLQGPYPVPPLVKQNTPPSNTSMQSNSLVVCEICDGYIKDLEQLRSHMQLIHKVKIHPKMLVSRPPLNCQKCQWRFFTDQGLERHLLGAHGLVTSNMQELANKSKDAGCCTICGRVYASKLVNHMNQVHKLTLKPAHLSYKCTVCSATFNLYRLFENHVYLVHSGAAKRPADGSSSPSKKLKSPNIEDDSHFDGEPKNHVEKRTEENLTKCSECGTDFRRNAAQTDKCEKCLKYDISHGSLNSKMS